MEHVGLKSELMLRRVGGSVTEREGYICIATPSTPDAYFGNALILPGPGR